MPSGYTAAIQDGKIDFKTFALQCACAFGACIMQCDDDNSIPPQEQEVSDHHLKSLNESNEQMAFLLSLSPEQLSDAAKSYYAYQVKNYNEAIESANRIKANYEAILADVDKWQPPTSEHTGLKTFMQTQIKDSISWDCSTDYYEKNKPVELSPEAYLAERKKSIQWNIDYHTKAYAEEVARTAERNKWIRDLYASLNG